MIRFLFFLLLLAQLTSVAQVAKPRVVMISIDGLPDYLLDHHLDNGLLPANGAFATIRKKGAYAKTVLPVNIASTGPSHISIFTGASPAQTGIVGNSFRQLSQPWNAPSLSAFRHPITAETIFQAAMRQGKKVMVLGGVGVDNSHVSRMTDYFLMYPIKTGASQSVNFLPSHPRQTVLLTLSSDYTIPLYCYLTDSAFNDANILRPIKQLLVDTDTDPTNGHVAALVADNWTTLQFQHKEKRYSTSLRLQLLDEDTQAYQLFINAPAEVVLFPENFQEQVQSSCGCWPGEPDLFQKPPGLNRLIS